MGFRSLSRPALFGSTSGPLIVQQGCPKCCEPRFWRMNGSSICRGLYRVFHAAPYNISRTFEEREPHTAPIRFAIFTREAKLTKQEPLTLRDFFGPLTGRF